MASKIVKNWTLEKELKFLVEKKVSLQFELQETEVQIDTLRRKLMTIKSNETRRF